MSERFAEIMLREKNLYPNVDFYSATVYYSLGIPPDLFTPLFAISRTSGWTAHVLEQLAANRLIRPRGVYDGPDDLKFQSINERCAKGLTNLYETSIPRFLFRHWVLFGVVWHQAPIGAERGGRKFGSVVKIPLLIFWCLWMASVPNRPWLAHFNATDSNRVTTNKRICCMPPPSFIGQFKPK